MSTEVPKETPNFYLTAFLYQRKYLVMQSRLQEQILTPPQYRHTKIHTNTHTLVKGDFSRIKMPAPMFISVLIVSPEIK